MTASLYDTLGVDKSATSAEIKAAYRKAAKTSHPDVGGSAEDFEKVSHACRVLTDQRARKKYDSTGDNSGAEPDNGDAEVLGMVREALNQAMAAPCGVTLNSDQMRLLGDWLIARADEIEAADVTFVPPPARPRLKAVSIALLALALLAAANVSPAYARRQGGKYLETPTPWAEATPQKLTAAPLPAVPPVMPPAGTCGMVKQALVVPGRPNPGPPVWNTDCHK